ncbi:hypothetical protein BDN70DRAFT_996482 [Pholiota conissans]|uniref:DUF6534 domain-containing protein n=1 Tax=Pholiota conissans TaxID=109636 RepID=A0A9P5YTT9_9AGAR|nr:hypothetical protein BDN70DRAFT_996482 [Pholiota conissans]
MGLFGLHLNLGPTSGAYLIGTFVSNVLLGATGVQMYIYFRSFQDPLFTKIRVLILLVLELLHGVLSMQAQYHYLIDNFGNPLALTSSIWSSNIMFSITGGIILVVHWSYAIRIFYISGSKILVPIVIVTISLAIFSLGICLSVELFINPSLLNLTGVRENLAKAGLTMAAFNDFLIASTLSFHLHRARTGFKKTDKILDKLTTYAVNNGILTSLTDIVALAFIFAFPESLYSVAISQVIGSLYSNSLMATLNSRQRPNVDDPSSFEFSSRALSTFGAAANPQIPVSTKPAVERSFLMSFDSSRSVAVESV